MTDDSHINRRELLLGAAAIGIAPFIPGTAEAEPERLRQLLGSAKAKPHNLELIMEHEISVRREEIPWKGHRIPLLALEKQGPHVPTIYVPHGDEPAAFTAALAAIADGGRIVTFDSGSSRYLLRDKNGKPFMDANRFFSTGSPYRDVGEKIWERLEGSPYLIALHTNRKGHSFEDDVTEHSELKEMHVVDEENARKIVWLSGFSVKKELRDRIVEALGSHGFNCLSESLPPEGALNGGLSQLCEEADKPYANCEAPAEDRASAEDLLRMLVVVLEAMESTDDAPPSQIATID